MPRLTAKEALEIKNRLASHLDCVTNAWEESSGDMRQYNAHLMEEAKRAYIAVEKLVTGLDVDEITNDPPVEYRRWNV